MGWDWHKIYETAEPSYTKVNDKAFADLAPGTTILIPSPADIEGEIGRLSADETISLTELRDRLADRHDADSTCPVMCGIHLRAVAETVLSEIDGGAPQHEVTPVWKAIDPGSPLAKKLPGGASRLRALRG